jgi:hypothetical protein
MTPECFCPICRSRMSPSFMSFFPEQRLGSQCPKSQQAALKAGREAGCWLSSPLPGGPLDLGALLYFLPPRDENPSFLCRTILQCMAAWSTGGGAKVEFVCRGKKKKLIDIDIDSDDVAPRRFILCGW